MLKFYDQLKELFDTSEPFVLVTVVDTVGSVPQDVGNKILVTVDGLYGGTVGGGKVEARAIAEARVMLGDDGERNTRFVNWSLHKDIGMTCGGSVKMFMEVYNRHLWDVVIFGSGHCANALINLLVNIDCRVTCYDTRDEWLSKLPDSSNLTKIHSADLPSEVANLRKNSFVILMTMGHTTDKPILIEVLKYKAKKEFPYVGVIGSAAKSARLRADVIEAGLPAESCRDFQCPMGLPIGSNNPYEIAISISAHIIELRDKLNEEKRDAAKLAEISKGAQA